MKYLAICLLFLCCSTPADAGVLNWFYTPPEVQLARIEAKAAKQSMRHEARENSRQRQHAQRYGVYHIPASTMRSYSIRRPVRSYQRFGSTIYWGW